MKFNEIVVDAFGPFSDLHLDLRGERNFHIIYGLNEAGKSSLLRAILALLFGIDAQTKDDFLHDYGALKISANIEAQNGQLLRFSRLKKKKDALRDLEGKPISESALDPFLAHQSQEAFVALYGLDHEELRRGGRDMLAGRGDLGRALFESGGAGALNRVLSEYRTGAEQLFASRAQRPLNLALRAVEESKRAIREHLLRSGDYQELQHQRSEAAAEVAQLRQGGGSLAIKLDRLKRIRENRQDLSLRDALLAQIARLGSLPSLPEGFTESRIRHTTVIESAETAIKKDSTEHATRHAALKTLPTEFPTIAFETAIGTLVRGLDGYRSSLKDLRKRKETSQAAYVSAVGIWRQLFQNTDLAQIEEFRLSVKETATLRALLLKREVRIAKQEQDEERLAEAKRSLGKEQEELQNSPQPKDVSTLRTILDAVKAQGPLEEDLKKAKSALLQGGRALETALRTVPRWNKSAEELRKLPVALTETIEKFIKVQADQLRRMNELERESDQASEEARLTREQIADLSGGNALPTLEELARERELRDRGWSLIRRVAIERDLALADASEQYEPPVDLGDAFEMHLRGADSIADRLIEDSQQVARNQELHRTLGRIAERSAKALAEKSSLQELMASTASEWTAQWQFLPFPVLSAVEMQGWLRKRDAAITALENEECAASDVDRAELVLNDAMNSIAGALKACGVQGKQDGETLASLLLRALNLVHEQDQLSNDLKSRQKAIRSLELEIPRLQAVVQQHIEEGASWETSWQGATLRFPEAHRSPEAVEGILQEIPELFKNWDEHCSLEQRVSSIQSDVDRFQQQVAGLCLNAAPELKTSAPDVTVEVLEKRLGKEKSETRQREALTNRIGELDIELALHHSQLKAARAELTCLCELAQVADANELAQTEKRVHDAAGFTAKINAIEEGLIRRNGCALQEILAETHGESLEELTSRIEQLKSNQNDLDRDREEAVKRLRDVENRLKEQENREAYEAAVQTRQMSISKSTDLAEGYVRQRLAAAVLEKAMESYRERNQAQVVARAGAIFAALTNHRYAGLLADSEEGGANKLFVIKAKDKSRLDVTSLSDGSADQLFLALRMASIEQRAATSEPLPCIFDDILVNYDDARTAAALDQLAELSRITQILLFTHHEKTIELAEKSCAARFTLHRLGVQAVAQHA